MILICNKEKYMNDAIFYLKTCDTCIRIMKILNLPEYFLKINIKENPITENQKLAVESWDEGDNLILSGSAGTGKTFLAISLGLEDVLDKETEYEKLTIVRSIVPTRDIGFLPGNEEEKKDAYTAPYRGILTEIFQDKLAWQKLTVANAIDFESTSFIRGVTFRDTIIIVDEMQNLTFHE